VQDDGRLTRGRLDHPGATGVHRRGVVVVAVHSRTLDLVITVEYDANIAADDACMPATMAFTADNDRTGMAWVPRVDFAIARTWSAASCVPGGYELTGWNTAGEGSGESIGLGAPLPESWMLSRTNERRLYAMWRAE